MKKRKAVGIVFYLLGTGLFIISNSAVVSGSPNQMEYWQRVVLCAAAVCDIGAAPFVYPSKAWAGTIVKFVLAAALIGCIFVFRGFAPNSMA